MHCVLLFSSTSSIYMRSKPLLLVTNSVSSLYHSPCAPSLSIGTRAHGAVGFRVWILLALSRNIWLYKSVVSTCCTSALR